MELSPLTAISPVDGRYYKQTEQLSAYFSEFALMRYRIMVEVEYFISLALIPLPQLASVDHKTFDKLRILYTDFSEADALRIKSIESITNHDVKAVEYFIKEKLEKLGLKEVGEFVHFGLTSQDINNTAVPASIKDAMNEVYKPLMSKLISIIEELSTSWKSVSMLARTHGQPASPTILGKEIFVFAERLNIQFKQLENVEYRAKFGGATGNFNAHHVAYPNTDWVAFANTFVQDTLGLTRSRTTTQIEHYDDMAMLCDTLSRINNILVDMCRDIWTYISIDYFGQKVKEGEVGSSAMPHKVNPIDFENAEGNLGMANAIFHHFSSKLPISRLQRDLTDSTVLRNVGIPFAHTIISVNSILKGLGKLKLNEAAIKNDLEKNWAVVAEAIQTILRRESYPEPYEALKALTRGKDRIDEEIIHQFIGSLDVSESIRKELMSITPANYTGVDLLKQF
ncbi:MAG: adenylosuccinate lyase [Flavobacteriales bacterium]|nr:adenylosuccinate lyase [Flavobacteriales bacterium]